MDFVLRNIEWVYCELGLKSLRDTGHDAWIIILLRSTRMLAYGTNSLILALFFSSLEFSDFHIGLFMTLTLLGDMILSLLLTLVADRVGRRRVLILGSFLMVLSGAAFAVFENFWILLMAAVLGVISATGGDFGPFRAIEESTLSHLTRPGTRADVLAWYVTTASLGSSIGTEISGRLLDSLQKKAGWTLIDAYHGVFWMYSGMGALNIVLSLFLSAKCESDAKESPKTTEEANLLLHEASPISQDDECEQPTRTAISQNVPGKQSYFGRISQATRSTMYKLWFLLIIDSLADGMVGYSLTVYYMDQKFSLSKSTLGDITSISYFLSSCFTVAAGPLSRRLGLINTMVFTHLPSSSAVLLFPVPSGIFLTVALFFLRTSLNNMDQAPRAAFIAAVVKPEERTAVMGITSMLRTLAATTGPTVTGILAGHDQFWIAFVTAGALRICYDLGLFIMFINMKLHQHEEDDDGDQSGRQSRELTQSEVGEGNLHVQ
jgi:MFS family permease